MITTKRDTPYPVGVAQRRGARTTSQRAANAKKSALPESFAGRYIPRERGRNDSTGAQTWLADDPVLGRVVEVTTVPPGHPKAEALSAGAKAAAALTGRAVARVLDVVDSSATNGAVTPPAIVTAEDNAIAAAANGSSNGTARTAQATPVEPAVVVVSEAVPGRTLSDFLTWRSTTASHDGGPIIPPGEATAIALQVARCVQTAHDQGVPHGRIRPSTVVVTETGEVRLRGFGVEAVLDGVSPAQVGRDVIAADVHGCAAVLYACLTGRWPDGADDELPTAPRVEDGRVPWPSRVVAGVPAVLDEVCARGLATCVPPAKSRSHYADASSITDALVLAAHELGVVPSAVPGEPGRAAPYVAPVAALPDPVVTTGQLQAINPYGAAPVAAPAAYGAVPAAVAPLAAPVAEPVRPGPSWFVRFLKRFAGFLIGVAIIAGMALVGALLLRTGDPLTTAIGPDTNPSISAKPTASAPVVEPSATPTLDAIIPIVDASDFDPEGVNGENPDLVKFATDDDPNTAWTTVVYKADNIAGKTGVGLVFDLGSPRSVSSVSLELVGQGTDLELRSSDIAPEAISETQVIASATGAGSSVTLRLSRPVSTRYLVVWLTKLPSLGSRYQGGIASITVRG